MEGLLVHAAKMRSIFADVKEVAEERRGRLILQRSLCVWLSFLGDLKTLATEMDKLYDDLAGSLARFRSMDKPPQKPNPQLATSFKTFDF